MACGSCGWAFAQTSVLTPTYQTVVPLNNSSYSRLATFYCYSNEKFKRAFKDAFDIDVNSQEDIKILADLRDKGLDMKQFKTDFVQFAGTKIPFTVSEIQNSSCKLAYSNGQ